MSIFLVKKTWKCLFSSVYLHVFLLGTLIECNYNYYSYVYVYNNLNNTIYFSKLLHSKLIYLKMPI